MNISTLQLLGTTYQTFPKLWIATHFLAFALLPFVLYGFRRRWKFSGREWLFGLSTLVIVFAIATFDLRHSWSDIGAFAKFWLRQCCFSVPLFFAASVLFTVLMLRIRKKIEIGLVPQSFMDRCERLILCVAGFASVLVILGGFKNSSSESGFAFGAIMAIVPGMVIGLSAGIIMATVRKPIQIIAGVGLSILMMIAIQMLWNPVSLLPSKFETSDGTIVAFRQGYTRDLVERGSQKVLLEMEDYPNDLNIVGDLAIFSWSRRRGGEVCAYNLKEQKLAWEFNAATEIPSLSVSAYTGVSVEREQVFVSVDQTIFALDVSCGELLWKTALPRQNIRDWDQPWTKFGRIGNNLIVKCYEDLFCLNVKSGELQWTLDCDPLERPPGQMVSYTPPNLARDNRPSAIVVSRDETSPFGYSFSFVSRNEIPSTEEVWWSLKPPPSPKNHSEEPALKLHIFNTYFKNPQYVCVLDISVPISETGKAYIKITSIEKVELWKGERLLLAAEPP